MIDLTLCSSSSTITNLYIVCPTLRASLALLTSMSTTMKGSISKEVPKETTNQVLGNAYTIVIALYLLWLVQNFAELSVSSVFISTGIAIALPLILYVPLSGYLAPAPVSQSTDANRQQPQAKKRTSPGPSRTSSKACSIPAAASVRRSSTSPSSCKRPQTVQRASDPAVATTTYAAHDSCHKPSGFIERSQSPLRRDSSESGRARKLFHCPSTPRLRSVSPTKSPARAPTDVSIASKLSGSSTKSRTAAKIKRIFSIHKDSRRQSI